MATRSATRREPLPGQRARTAPRRGAPRPLRSINPATGEEMTTFTPHSADEVAHRVERAAAAFRQYRRTSFAERAGWLGRAAAILEARADELGRLITLEMGKPI